MKIFKRKNKNHLYALALVYALMLSVSVVYASFEGSITFSGTANLGNKLHLEIIPQNSTSSVASGSYGTMEITDNGNTATITVSLLQPGDFLNFSFYLKNTGLIDAFVDSVIYNSEGPLVLDGTFKNLKDARVAAGTDSVEYTIAVGWVPNMGFYADGEYKFDITINYSDAQ